MRNSTGQFCADPLLDDVGSLNVAQHQILWLRILEAVEEAQAAELMTAAANDRDVEVIPLDLADRVQLRGQRVLAQMDARELLTTALGLSAALNFIQQALQELLCQRMEILDAQRARESGHDRPQESGEEEEVQPDDDEREKTALMQVQQAVRREEDPTWRPLSREDRQSLEQALRRLLPRQSNPEPTLTLLAMLGVEAPLNCHATEDETDETLITIGYLRTAIARWMWATPAAELPEVIRAVLGVRGKPHGDALGNQRIARSLQNKKRNGPLIMRNGLQKSSITPGSHPLNPKP